VAKTQAGTRFHAHVPSVMRGIKEASWYNCTSGGDFWTHFVASP